MSETTGDPEYLTVKEVADLLRLKERKIYDLVASNEIPHARAFGKLLFDRNAIKGWVTAQSAGPSGKVRNKRPGIVLGSHDPLLEWALREARCGLATYFDSSRDGLQRFASSEGIAAGLHLPNAKDLGWNTEALTETMAASDSVLIEWAMRSRGIISQYGELAGAKGIEVLRGCRIAIRQPEAGSQILFERLLQDAAMDQNAFEAVGPALSEKDAVDMVLDGKADACFGLSSLAKSQGLDFRAMVEERYDLLIDRVAFFDPALQSLFRFTRTAAFEEKAAALGGYDIAGLGTVHFNGFA